MIITSLTAKGMELSYYLCHTMTHGAKKSEDAYGLLEIHAYATYHVKEKLEE